MIKTLLALPAIAASAISLAGCPPPPDPQPTCHNIVSVIPEPPRESLAGMNTDCQIDVFLDPYIVRGQYPWRRCVSYWHGTFVDNGVTWVCEDVTL